MVDFYITSHGRLAEGMLDSLKMFLGNEIRFKAIAAYVDENSNLEEEIDKLVKNISNEDKIVFFTDILGGSVNQVVTKKALEHTSVYVISGFNFPLILELAALGENIDETTIREVVERSKDSIVYVNDYIALSEDEDE